MFIFSRCRGEQSLFEERLPIGLMSVVKTVPAETVRAFYARHYHPERMAVVAVGDFEDGGERVVREGRGGGKGEARRRSPPQQSTYTFIGSSAVLTHARHVAFVLDPMAYMSVVFGHRRTFYVARIADPPPVSAVDMGIVILFLGPRLRHLPSGGDGEERFRGVP